MDKLHVKRERSESVCVWRKRRASTCTAGLPRGRRTCDPHQSQDVAPAAGLPGSSDYRSMEQRILFLSICIGKGLSWMVREVKFKAQRCFEGQWVGLLMMGGCEDATLDRWGGRA